MAKSYIIFMIFLCAGITFFLRLFPFILIKTAKRYQNVFRFLGTTMPSGIMGILAGYCVINLYWQSPAQILVSLLALSILVGLEHFYRQPMISIFTALSVYVIGQSFIH